MDKPTTSVYIYLVGNFILTAVLLSFASSTWKKNHNGEEGNPMAKLVEDWAPYGAAAMIILMLVNAATS
jgi:hypothetical protein